MVLVEELRSSARGEETDAADGKAKKRSGDSLFAALDPLPTRSDAGLRFRRSIQVRGVIATRPRGALAGALR